MEGVSIHTTFKTYFYVILFIYALLPTALAQEPSIFVYPDDGFIFELDPNNSQTTLAFTIFNVGQNPVSLNLGIESADSTYLLYLSEPDTNTFNGNIWKMRPDGSEKTQLTFDTLDREATWSPDGSKIAFWSYRSGDADIWVMDSDGTNMINLTNDAANDFNPSWSPDSQYIIFSSDRDDPNLEIYRMTPAGTNLERLTVNGIQDRLPRYSPDGQYFATQSRPPGGGFDIYVYTSDGQSFVNLGVPNVNHDFQPSWSPDSKRVIWASGNQNVGGLEIISANKDSSGFQNEFSDNGNEYIPRYSPDGQFLAFSKATFTPIGGDELFVWHKLLDTLVQVSDSTPFIHEWSPEWSPFINPPAWASVTQDTVQIISGDSISIEINVDASGLPFSRHTASVMIYNSDNNNVLAVVPLNLFYVQASDVNELQNVPKSYSLSQNYPNPFNPTTVIRYEIPERSFITLKVYDVLANEVATLINTEKPAGSYEVEFNADRLSSGVYFYKLKAGNYLKVKKMILIR